MANNVEYNITGSDEWSLSITITIDGVKYSMRELEDKYNEACRYDSDEAMELEEISFEAWKRLRDAKWNSRQQRISNFWANNPDHECEDSDPVIRHW